MVVDKPMVEDKDTVHTDNKEVNKVEPMEVTYHLPVKSNSHNMEVHHIHNLMDQQCRKIYLKINRKEKFSLVVLVVILKKMFTIISLNSEQLKIISLKDVQWQVHQKVSLSLFSKSCQLLKPLSNREDHITWMEKILIASNEKNNNMK